MSEDIRNILLAVCALGCTCAGLLGVVAFAAIRFAGTQIMPLVSNLLTGGRGDADADNSPVASVRSQVVSASESLRQRAKSIGFEGAAAAAATAFVALSQNQQPENPDAQAGRTPARRSPQTSYAPQNDPLAYPGQSPAAPANRYPAQNDPLAYPGQPPAAPPTPYTAQSLPARPGQPPANRYPVQNDPLAYPGQPPAAYPPQNPSLAPLTGRPANYPAQNNPAPQPYSRPTLSTGKAPSLSDDPFDANTLPGLRNQRARRRGSDGEQIYDDDGDGNDWNDLIDSFNPL